MRIDLHEVDEDGRQWDIIVDGELMSGAHVKVFTNIYGDWEVKLNDELVAAEVYRNGVLFADTTTPVPKIFPLT